MPSPLFSFVGADDHCIAGHTMGWPHVCPSRVCSLAFPCHSNGYNMLVSWRKDQEMQGAPLAQWDIKGVWCHAKHLERTHSGKTMYYHQAGFHDCQERTSSHVSRRQTIHISYCFLRHLLPSVYSSFHKPMSHVTCFWVQATSLLWVIPEWAPSEIWVVAWTGLLFWVLFTGWNLFYMSYKKVFGERPPSVLFASLMANCSEPLNQIPLLLQASRHRFWGIISWSLVYMWGRFS